MKRQAQPPYRMYWMPLSTSRIGYLRGRPRCCGVIAPRDQIPGYARAACGIHRLQTQHISGPIDLLTTREREVLQMIAKGKTNKEIANTQKLSVYTVEAQWGYIMERLNLHSTGELVRFMIRNGLID
jgi:DNA-binding NarL/FixJ family response regulator